MEPGHYALVREQATESISLAVFALFAEVDSMHTAIRIFVIVKRFQNKVTHG
jgi:hypothetical protein